VQAEGEVGFVCLRNLGTFADHIQVVDHYILAFFGKVVADDAFNITEIEFQESGSDTQRQGVAHQFQPAYFAGELCKRHRHD